MAEAPKSLAQILLVAGIAVLSPIAVNLIQYGELREKINNLEEEQERFANHIDPANDHHPPRDFRRLVKSRDENIKDQLNRHEQDKFKHNQR